MSAPEPFDLNDALGAELDSAAMLALNAHLYESYFHDLQAERDALREAVREAVAAEREAILKMLDDNWYKTQSDVAAAIRARGEA